MTHAPKQDWRAGSSPSDPAVPGQSRVQVGHGGMVHFQTENIGLGQLETGAVDVVGRVRRVASALTPTATPAFAQGVDPALDVNADGMFSFTEVMAGYPDMTEDMFTTMDANGDGLLDADEVTAAVDAGTLKPMDG